MKYNVDVVVKVDNYANDKEALFYTYRLQGDSYLWS